MSFLDDTTTQTLQLANLTFHLKPRPSMDAKLQIRFDTEAEIETIYTNIQDKQYRLDSYWPPSKSIELSRMEITLPNGDIQVTTTTQKITVSQDRIFKYRRNEGFEEKTFYIYQKSYDEIGKIIVNKDITHIEIQLTKETKDLVERLLWLRHTDTITYPIKITWCYDKITGQSYTPKSQVCESAIPNGNSA